MAFTSHTNLERRDAVTMEGNLNSSRQMVRPVSILVGLALAVVTNAIEASSSHLLSFIWPEGHAARIDQIGRGIGVVFSPDLSVPGNCRFYQSLGFACFQDADWNRILDEVHRYDLLNPDRRLSTLVLETHGTNGNGLKLQRSYNPQGERSYVSVGALQEHLEEEGIYNVVISACNAGRLLRPYIYNELDPYNGDKLFLPATCGIVNASSGFDGSRSPVLIIRPESSHIETTLVGSIRELPAGTRNAILASAKALHITPPTQFAVSDMMVQMVTRDPRLELISNSYVDELSPEIQSVDRSEELFRRFVTYLNAVAARQAIPVARRARTAKTPSSR